MGLPEQARKGTQAHASAVERLELARSEQQQSSSAHDAAVQTDAEPAAASHLAGANEQVAAREAWVEWVERDD